MRVVYTLQKVVDCTSDPHYVRYGPGEVKQVLAAMFEDIVRVCKSDLILGVRSVRGVTGDTLYVSDVYDESEDLAERHGRTKAAGAEAEKHRVAGLYWYSDPPWGPWRRDRRQLSPGLTGVKQFVGQALARPEAFSGLHIGVVWTFAGESACADYIDAGDFFEPLEFGVVNYGSQTWWRQSEQYEPWCRQMAEFLDRPFPHAHGAAYPGDTQ